MEKHSILSWVVRRYRLKCCVFYLRKKIRKFNLIIHALTGWGYNFDDPVGSSIAAIFSKFIRITNNRNIGFKVIVVIPVQKNSKRCGINLTGNLVVSRQEVRRYLLLYRYFPLPVAWQWPSFKRYGDVLIILYMIWVVGARDIVWRIY